MIDGSGAQNPYPRNPFQNEFVQAGLVLHASIIAFGSNNMFDTKRRVNERLYASHIYSL